MSEIVTRVLTLNHEYGAYTVELSRLDGNVRPFVRLSAYTFKYIGPPSLSVRGPLTDVLNYIVKAATDRAERTERFNEEADG